MRLKSIAPWVIWLLVTATITASFIYIEIFPRTAWAKEMSPPDGGGGGGDDGGDDGPDPPSNSTIEAPIILDPNASNGLPSWAQQCLATGVCTVCATIPTIGTECYVPVQAASPPPSQYLSSSSITAPPTYYGPKGPTSSKVPAPLSLKIACLANALQAAANDPSSSIPHTGSASDPAPIRDANPMDMITGTYGTTAGTGVAAKNGAIGGDRTGLSSTTYSIAIFPNLGTGMLAAQQLLKSYGSFTINQILGPLSGTGQSNTVNATTTAVLSASGLDGDATISSLSQVQLNTLIASFMSQSEGYHPASCGW